MDDKVTEVHEFIRVRKGDLKLGSDYLKRGELEDWVCQLTGDFYCDFDGCPPILPNYQVFWCLFARGEHVTGIGQLQACTYEYPDS
jgi:hypothetical protein